MQNLTKNIEADILKETLVNKISKELGVSKEALVALKKSAPKANAQLVEQPSRTKTDKSFLLFIYIYSNFKDSIIEKGALNFVINSEEEVLAAVKKVIKKPKIAVARYVPAPPSKTKFLDLLIKSSLTKSTFHLINKKPHECGA